MKEVNTIENAATNCIRLTALNGNGQMYSNSRCHDSTNKRQPRQLQATTVQQNLLLMSVNTNSYLITCNHPRILYWRLTVNK